MVERQSPHVQPREAYRGRDDHRGREDQQWCPDRQREEGQR